jgi:hypothetical protein
MYMLAFKSVVTDRWCGTLDLYPTLELAQQALVMAAKNRKRTEKYGRYTSVGKRRVITGEKGEK